MAGEAGDGGGADAKRQVKGMKRKAPGRWGTWWEHGVGMMVVGMMVTEGWWKGKRKGPAAQRFGWSFCGIRSFAGCVMGGLDTVLAGLDDMTGDLTAKRDGVGCVVL